MKEGTSMGIKELRLSHILNPKSGKSVIIPIDQKKLAPIRFG